MGSLQSLSCLDRGTFSLLPLICFYLPKSDRAYLFQQSVKVRYFCSGPIRVDPISPRPSTAPERSDVQEFCRMPSCDGKRPNTANASKMQSSKHEEPRPHAISLTTMLPLRNLESESRGHRASRTWNKSEWTSASSMCTCLFVASWWASARSRPGPQAGGREAEGPRHGRRHSSRSGQHSSDLRRTHTIMIMPTFAAGTLHV